ncbi:hypothetical protein CDD80_4244 [Ophiocordyceps camponoti-rufipedis]|uniref:Uncharacterized protein n=1 Tax=Ophiocordyceps camponoti-rufipedis TaxID=2004952 RepID=A0A2C5XHR3_9HYPO|nr:hypothetical protein CDD80_4244 [Ophiocordyceps camponoti-rufipedis]
MLWSSATAPFFLAVSLLGPSASMALPPSQGKLSPRWSMPLPLGQAGGDWGAAPRRDSPGSSNGASPMNGAGNGGGRHTGSVFNMPGPSNRPLLAGARVAQPAAARRQFPGGQAIQAVQQQPPQREQAALAEPPLWRPWETPTRRDAP